MLEWASCLPYSPCSSEPNFYSVMHCSLLLETNLPSINMAKKQKKTHDTRLQEIIAEQFQ